MNPLSARPLDPIKSELEQIGKDPKANDKVDSLVQGYLKKLSENLDKGSFNFNDLEFIDKFLQNRQALLPKYEKLQTQRKMCQELFNRSKGIAAKNPFISMDANMTRLIAESLPIQDRIRFAQSTIGAAKGLKQSMRLASFPSFLQALNPQKYSNEIGVIKNIFDSNQKLHSSVFSKSEKQSILNQAIFEILFPIWKIDPQLQDNEEVSLFILSQLPHFDNYEFSHISVRLQGDPEFMLKAVKQDGRTFEFASAALRGNPEVVKAAIALRGVEAFQFASDELKGNPKIVKAAVAKHGMALRFASDELRGNYEIVKAAVTQDGGSLQYASAALRGNPEIVKAAVTEEGRALRYASFELIGNLDIVKAAVTNNGMALEFVLDELTGNPEIVKAAVTNDGMALKYASNELRGDPEIVKVALRQTGWALKHASAALRDNPEIVKVAVTNNGMALEFASAKLRGKFEIVKAAVTKYGEALRFASDKLKNNPEIRRAAGLAN
jgi:hypothetical protein